MKIDQEYLKTILNTFIESPRSFIWVEDLINNGIELDDKFLFHVQILEDQHFIECLDKKSDIGYEITLVSNSFLLQKTKRYKQICRIAGIG